MTFDPIHKPSHYAEGRKYETIDVIEDWQLSYRLGNAVKYVSRAGRKDPTKTAEDLRKAIWYIEREIASLEGAQSPYSVTYEDVLEDHAACAATGEQLLNEYGLGEVEDIPFDATDRDWEQFWNEFQVDVTPTSINLGRKNDGIKGVAGDDLLWDPTLGPVELSQDEIEDTLSRKSLDQFTPDEIVSTVERRGMIIGVKKDGSTCLLKDGRCQ